MNHRLINTSTGFKSSFKLSALLLSVLFFFVAGASDPATALDSKQAQSTTNAYKYAQSLKPKAWDSHDGYARSKFSQGWGDIVSGGHKCDLRNYILARDLKNIVRRSGDWCIVESGTLLDKYTGKTINFVRGRSTSLAVQIDHVVALSNAWSTGAQAISVAARYSIANDPMNLLAVDGPTNGSKSDKDAASFLPRLAYQCSYVARQLAVKKKYHLWVTSSEKTAMVTVLKTCPKQTLPTK